MARPARRHRLASALLLGLLLACGGDDPIVTGVPARPLLADADEAVAVGEAGPEAAAEAEPYRKADDVYVDVQRLAGRSFQEERAELGEQLGSLLSSHELGGENGRELEFTKGTLRVADDQVYMVRVPLPHPARRGEALEMTGFPPQVDRYITLHREYRLNHQWGFRRIRMRRADAESELVTEVEAWRWVPGEHTTHR